MSHVSSGRVRDRSAREPAGQPTELVVAALPEERPGLQRSPEARRLDPDRPRLRIADDGFPEEGELVDRCGDVGVLEERRRRAVARRDVPRLAVVLATRLLARPRDAGGVVVAEDRAQAVHDGGRRAAASGERLDLAVQTKEVAAIALEPRRRAVGAAE